MRKLQPRSNLATKPVLPLPVMLKPVYFAGDAGKVGNEPREPAAYTLPSPYAMP